MENRSVCLVTGAVSGYFNLLTHGLTASVRQFPDYADMPTAIGGFVGTMHLTANTKNGSRRLNVRGSHHALMRSLRFQPSTGQ